MKILLFTIIAGLVFSTSFGAESWDDFDPPVDTEYDWIQLTSGEWLKGDFKVLYDFVVEFDSDEMDLQKFDIDDVRQLRTRNSQVIRLEPHWGQKEESEVHGQLTIDGNNVTIRQGESEIHRKRDDIVAIARDTKNWRDYWSGSASIGITARGGNTETTDMTTMINLRRRKASNRFIADYIGNYSEANDVESANNHRLTGTYDWFISTRFFWQILGAQYYRDPFSNIDNQYSVATAFGYDLIRSSRTEWEVSLGGGYQRQSFVSVIAPEDPSVDTPFLLATTRYDVEVTKSVDFLAEYNFRILNEVSGTYTHHALAKVSTEFIGDFDLDLSLIWDHIQTPQAKDDGTLPKSDDYQLVFSLAYDF